jgi:hypothetical protein
MCRSIKQLRNAEVPTTEEEIHAAALQFVRKVSGYRKPSKVNQAAFDQAVEEVITVTQQLLDNLSIHFERYLQKANLAGLWVAEEGSVVGMANLLIDEEEAEIEPIVIHSKFCSRGVGTLLIEKLKTEVKHRGVGYLSIKPVARNVEAILRFHRAGFSLLSHIDMFLDLMKESDQAWKAGITIHEHAFRY